MAAEAASGSRLAAVLEGDEALVRADRVVVDFVSHDGARLGLSDRPADGRRDRVVPQPPVVGGGGGAPLVIHPAIRNPTNIRVLVPAALVVEGSDNDNVVDHPEDDAVPPVFVMRRHGAERVYARIPQKVSKPLINNRTGQLWGRVSLCVVYDRVEGGETGDGEEEERVTVRAPAPDMVEYVDVQILSLGRIHDIGDNVNVPSFCLEALQDDRFLYFVTANVDPYSVSNNNNSNNSTFLWNHRHGSAVFIEKYPRKIEKCIRLHG